MLGLLAAEWKAAGSEVVEVRGASRMIPADLAILHVDLSVVPEPYRELASRYPRCLNAWLTDITRRALSLQRIERDTSWKGPVIAKTDRNAQGHPERRLAHGRFAAAVLWRAERWLRLAPPPLPRYRVFDGAAEVPEEVWSDERLVVEKFLPERDGEHFILRKCFFLGATATAFRLRSTDPIAKGVNSERVGPVEVPEPLREFRRRIGLDWGRIDYAQPDGELVIFDVNKTPSIATANPSLATRQVARDLALGIRQFLE